VTHYLNYKPPTKDPPGKMKNMLSINCQNCSLIQQLTNWETQFYENCGDQKNTHLLNTKNNEKTSHFMHKVPVQHTRHLKHAQQWTTNPFASFLLNWNHIHITKIVILTSLSFKLHNIYQFIKNPKGTMLHIFNLMPLNKTYQRLAYHTSP